MPSLSLSQYAALLITVVAAGSPFCLSADDTIYTAVDLNPVPIKTPPPDYPSEMRRSGISGVVAVTIVIDENGVVVSANATKSSHPDFISPAVEAVKRWKFKPAKKDGAVVKMKVTVPIRFNVDE